MTLYRYWYTKVQIINDGDFCEREKEVRQSGYVKTFGELEQKVKTFVQEMQTATELKGADSVDVDSWNDNGFHIWIRKGKLTYAYYLGVETRTRPD